MVKTLASYLRLLVVNYPLKQLQGAAFIGLLARGKYRTGGKYSRRLVSVKCQLARRCKIRRCVKTQITTTATSTTAVNFNQKRGKGSHVQTLR